VQRVVAFTDGVFAIAITLLVLSLDVPNVADDRIDHELAKQWPELLAYFVSFAVVGRFWLIHHRVFAAIGSFDNRLMSLNLAYLSFVVLVPFTTEILGEYGDTSAAAMVYAAALGIAALLNWAMIRHVVHRDHLREDSRAETARYASRGWLTIPAVFLLSIPVALINPLVAEGMWVALVFSRPIQRTRSRSTTSSR
jgi:uncharacterized membrane protein